MIYYETRNHYQKQKKLWNVNACIWKICKLYKKDNSTNWTFSFNFIVYLHMGCWYQFFSRSASNLKNHFLQIWCLVSIGQEEKVSMSFWLFHYLAGYEVIIQINPIAIFQKRP
jgi:hypothetical protein